MVFKILKSSANFLLNFKFVTRLMKKYFQMKMLIGYFWKLISGTPIYFGKSKCCHFIVKYYRDNTEIFQYISDAASFLLNYYGEPFEIVQYISQCHLQTLKRKKRKANSFEYHFQIYQRISEYSNTRTGVFSSIFKQCTNRL